jgi:hypothetical protein
MTAYPWSTKGNNMEWVLWVIGVIGLMLLFIIGLTLEKIMVLLSEIRNLLAAIYDQARH